MHAYQMLPVARSHMSVQTPGVPHARDVVRQSQCTRRREHLRVRTRVPDAEHMNICSGPQIRQLLFPGVPNARPDKGMLELQRTFKVGHLRAGNPGGLMPPQRVP